MKKALVPCHRVSYSKDFLVSVGVQIVFEWNRDTTTPRRFSIRGFLRWLNNRRLNVPVAFLLYNPALLLLDI